MSTVTRRKPAYGHLFWWFMFANGGGLTALLLPAHILVQGIFAHRLRYLLVDVGVHAAKSIPAQVIFYGGAVIVTLVAIFLLLTVAPISFG
jgi:fumarate reductase subunit D